MPDFLADPPSTTYFALACVVAGAVVYWYRNQDRRAVVVLAAAAGLLGGVYLIDLFSESPREEAVRRVAEMVAGINDSRPKAVAEHVSDRFRYATTTKATFESARLWSLLREHAVQVSTWDFDRGYVERPDADTVAVGFMAKVVADQGQGAFYVRAEFGRDPDGAFRVRGFRVFSDPLRKANGPEYHVPGVP